MPKTNISVLVNVRGVEIGADETLTWLADIIITGLLQRRRQDQVNTDFSNGIITIDRHSND